MGDDQPHRRAVFTVNRLAVAFEREYVLGPVEVLEQQVGGVTAVAVQHDRPGFGQGPHPLHEPFYRNA